MARETAFARSGTVRSPSEVLLGLNTNMLLVLTPRGSVQKVGEPHTDRTYAALGVTPYRLHTSHSLYIIKGNRSRKKACG